jgi:hypothetical protein
MLKLIGQLQAPTSLSPIKYMIVYLVTLRRCILFLIELLVNFTHFILRKAEDDFEWCMYVRGRRMVVAYLRHSNQVTEEQCWPPQSEWTKWELVAPQILRKPCEYPLHTRDTSRTQWIDTSSVHSGIRIPAVLTVTRNLCPLGGRKST